MTARRRPAGAKDDGGYALIFVLLVTTVVMIATATMLVVVANNVQPARRSQDSTAAVIAAQAGIQDYVSRLDAYCASYSIETCPWLLQQKSAPVLGTVGQQSYSTSAQSWSNYLVSNNGTLRVSSTGTSPAGSADSVSRTLTADISALPTPLAFTYFSDFETLGSAFLNSYYPARTISITDPGAAAAAGVPVGTRVTWKGAGAAPSDGDSDDVCNALYYDSPANPSATGAGRYSVGLGRTDLPAGTDFAEDGSTATPTQQLTATSTPVTRFAPCEVTFSRGMSFTGPVYSRDALYLSNGEWGSTSGPQFTVPAGEPLPAASTAWTPGRTPAAPATNPYRSFPQLGGAPTAASGAVTSFPYSLSLPTSANPSATCTYSGPTRIVLSGTTATVSSPLTSPGAGACYTSTQTGSGVVAASVPVGTTTILVKDSPSALTTAPAFPDLTLGGNGDVTTYDRSKGDAYVQGTLTGGKLSIVTAHDVVVTGNLRTAAGTATQPSTTDPVSGERSWSASAGAIDLVATNDVRVYHPVACLSGTASSGYCPNDITGLYTTTQAGAVIAADGSLNASHPARQYCNLTGATRDCSTTASVDPATPNREIDAAVFALNGSLHTDNFDRGRSLGTLKVDGGVYENHRGAVGTQWELRTSTGTGTRPSSGYALQITYLNYQRAGLGYVPELQGGDPRVWHVVSVSTGGTP